MHIAENRTVGAHINILFLCLCHKFRYTALINLRRRARQCGKVFPASSPCIRHQFSLCIGKQADCIHTCDFVPRALINTYGSKEIYIGSGFPGWHIYFKYSYITYSLTVTSVQRYQPFFYIFLSHDNLFHLQILLTGQYNNLFLLQNLPRQHNRFPFTNSALQTI